MIELPEEDAPVVALKRGKLDQVRVNRVRYRGTKWVTLRHWALDPGHGWKQNGTAGGVKSLTYSLLALSVGAVAGCSHPPLPLTPPPAQLIVPWDVNGGPDNVVYHDGIATLISQSNGVFVGASLFTGNDFTRAQVMIVNKTDYAFAIYPQQITAEIVAPQHRALGYCNPDEVIKHMERSANWGNFFAALGGTLAKQTTTTTSQIDGSDQYGNWQANVISTTTTPDIAAQQRAQQTIANTNTIVALGETAILRSALRVNTIYSGGTISGIVLFDHLRGPAQTLVLRVFIRGTAFEFPFDVSKRK